VQLNPTGTLVLTSSSAGTPRLWDAQTGELVRTFTGHTNRVSLALFSPDVRHVITASSDGSARLWDLTTGEEKMRFRLPDRGDVEWLQISSDSSRLITRWYVAPQPGKHETRGVSLWDMTSGQEIMQFTNPIEQVLGFAPVDQNFIMVKENNPMALWDGAAGKVIRSY